MKNTSYDYYYGEESNQFSFYRIPRQLIVGANYKRLRLKLNCCMGSFWIGWNYRQKTVGMTIPDVYISTTR